MPGDDDPIETASPPCSLHEANDVYAGFAGKDELIAFCNELLEAERAGAKAAAEMARGGGTVGDLMRAVQRDEARWCALLAQHLTALGGTPSSAVGAFYEKVIAITDPQARIALLNRGQSWVVRKLRDMLPRVRDDRLHAALKAMLS